MNEQTCEKKNKQNVQTNKLTDEQTENEQINQ